MNALEWFGDVACVPEERHAFDQLFAAINHTKDHKTNAKRYGATMSMRMSPFRIDRMAR